MEIKWKSGTQYQIDADVAYKQVDKIRKKNDGDVTADAVVSAAKATRNPLHKAFQWDNEVAGHEFRLEQARRMLRSFVIVRDDMATTRPQRAFEVVDLQRTKDSKSNRPSKAYRTVEDIMQDPDTRAELLGRALRELIAIRNRFRDLQELVVVMRAIDEVVTNIES